MKKELKSSKKSLDSLKGKKFGNLKMINAGYVDAEMAQCITMVNSGGTQDDSSYDWKK